jgi:membrane protease subunit (stomatin/prohibitin family)
MQIVGSQIGADSEKVRSYFIGEIIQKLSNTLANAVVRNQISVLNISAATNDLSDLVSKEIESEFKRFGVELINFNIESISIPDEELEKIQAVFHKKMEAEQLSSINVGGAYTAVKSFETLKTAAENTSDGGGAVGGMLGAGIGLGAGLPIGQQLGQQMNVNTPQQTAQDDSPKLRLEKLKALFDDNLITEEDFNKRKTEILSEI